MKPGAVVVASAVCAGLLGSCATSLLGESRCHVTTLAAGDIVVPLRQAEPPLPAGPAEVERLIASWADKPLPDWRTSGTVNAPRIALAKLALKRDVEAVSRYLRAQEPWGRVGSTWPLHPEGDYDFVEIPLCAMLGLFGGDSGPLDAETAAHILGTLLTQEGARPKTMVPRTLGMVRDTENHILMTEGSRYLKNQELRKRGSTDPRHDNAASGLEEWLHAKLVELERAGLHEFNSDPYLGYAAMALLTLEGLAASSRVRAQARLLLDTMALQYAYGSLDFRRYAPFRRRLERAARTALDGDPLTALVKTWVCLARPERTDIRIESNPHQALYAALMPYRLQRETVELAERKREPYYVRFGRGPSASPEIYSGGPGYLVSAGGCGRGRHSSIVARPIVLLLHDGARDLDGTFHIPGAGRFTTWNNTGVLPLFAVGEQPVHVPAWASPSAEATYPETSVAAWRIYAAPDSSLFIAVFSGPHLGIIALFPDWTGTARSLAEALVHANPDTAALARAFSRPGERGPFREATYDAGAPPGTWVVASMDGRPADRAYDRWPRMSAGMR